MRKATTYDLKEIHVPKKSHFALKTELTSIDMSLEQVVSFFEGYFNPKLTEMGIKVKKKRSQNEKKFNFSPFQPNKQRWKD